MMDCDLNDPHEQVCEQVTRRNTSAAAENCANSEVTFNEIINDLVNDSEICFKNQQRGEADLQNEEKSAIAKEIFEKSKVLFLTRFGRFLKPEQLNYFKVFEKDSEGYEVSIILQDLIRTNSHKKRNVNVKNRRYEALKELIGENSYFSEVEMMKRNPLLYEQMVGQYLTKAEKLERDRINRKDLTFVKLLMEKIERDESDSKKAIQERYEDDVMEEQDSDSDEEPDPKVDKSQHSWYEDVAPSTSYRWGEIESKSGSHNSSNVPPVTPKERNLLRDEFVAIMYESFLDGKDTDFNYKEVDDNEKYDNIDAIDKDEEEKYFDAEDPEEAARQTEGIEVVSEDELDMYMNALQQHPAVTRLSQDMQRL